MSTYEKQLGTFVADEPGTRIELVQVAEPNETPTLEFRYQRQCEDLGWVTHRRMKMAAGQVGDLKSALGMMDPDARDADRVESASVTELFEVVGDGQKQSSG